MLIRLLLILLAVQFHVVSHSQQKTDSILRIIFIPGFGEDPSIFEKLHPLINGEKLFIDNWLLLQEVESKNLNVSKYADFLISRFSITSDDVVIGHSMGGWIALFIKQKVNCPIVQVGSWTDKRKVFNLPIPKWFIYWSAKNGLVFHSVSRKLIVFLFYRNKPSKNTFISIYKNLENGNKDVVNKELKVILNRADEKVTVEPDIRIHALDDPIVRYPNAPFIKVPGDHFSLYTHPATVSKPISELLSLIIED